ncbi:MAG TPA: hypothetical protein VM864_10335 [Pyrinomonadaceae bacterium]|nr:hypothetical protein [Pyrinomonadaceae bacterium]
MAEIFQTHYALEGDAETRARRFVRWVGGSVALHALLLAALVYVPAVRDTFSLANQLAGFRVVSKDYQKTEVYERAVLVNLAAQKLYYPAGYFEVASQTAPPAPPSPDDPKFVATVNPTPEPTPKPVKVKPTPSPSPEASPSPKAAEDAAQGEKAKGADASASPADPKSVEDAEQKLKEANQEKFPEINTKPFEDLLAQGKKMKDAGEIDLTGTLEMSVEADRQDNGKLAHVEITGASASDPKLHQLAKDFIAALSDSELLKVLDGARHLHMKVRLDDKQVSVRVMTELESADLASKKTNAYNGMLWLGALSKKGQDEEAIFKSVKINNEEKQVVLTLQMPRKDAGALLSKITEKNKPTPPGE